MNPFLIINKHNKTPEEIAELPRLFSSRCVLFDEHKNVVLMSCQSEKKEIGQYYALPGGKIEEGETPEEACKREVREEAGFVLETVTPLFEIVVIKKDSYSVTHGFMSTVISTDQKELQLTLEEKAENQKTEIHSFPESLFLFQERYLKNSHPITLRDLTFLLEAKRILNSKE